MERNDIQKIIITKAERRLNKDIIDYLKSFVGNKLFEAIGQKEVDDDTLKHFLWSQDDPAAEMIKKHFLPIYIEEESNLFFEKIEKMNNTFQDLLNQ